LGALIAKSMASEICPKIIISHISQGADDLPLRAHEQVKLSKRWKSVCCLELWFTGRPKKTSCTWSNCIESRQGKHKP
jgi:hypothetical protein